MRNEVAIALTVSVLLLAAGCEEPFNPKVPVRDEYALQCYIEALPGRPSSTVVALLARVYDVNGFNPSVNTNDPSVAGAAMTMTLNGRVYPMKDTLRFNPDSLRYGSRQLYYRTRMPLPAPTDPISISVRLPDGRTLNAQTEAPRMRPFTSSFDFPQGITTRMNFPPDVKNWMLSWDDGVVSDPHLFFTQLVIDFVRKEDSVEVPGTVVVPQRYIAGTNGSTPLYPSYTMETSLTFEFAAIDSAMASISAGDPDKGRYGVHTVRIVVMEYDTPLSKYYSSVHGSLDQFSIRVDQPVYSNIGGGIGIFGTFYINRAQYLFDQTYVTSFGYKYR
jgi:hypothetical protein